MNQQPTNNKYRGDKAQIECFSRRSKDGKYFIDKTVITHIMRVEDVEAVLRGDALEEVDV